MQQTSKKRGFTLLEIIFVIVLSGGLTVVLANILRTPIKAYYDAKNIVETTASLDMALYNIKEDIINSVPNSVRVKESGSVSAVELFPTTRVLRYRKELLSDGAEKVLEVGSTDTEFYVAGDLPISGWTLGTQNSNYRLVVNNIGSIVSNNYDQPVSGANLYSQAAGAQTITNAGLNIRIDSESSNEYPVTLSSGHDFGSHSPNQLIYVSPGPVSYVCNENTGEIHKVTGYSESAIQPTNITSSPLSSGTVSLMLEKVSACEMSWDKDTDLFTFSVTLSTGEIEVHIFNQAYARNSL